MCTSSTGAMLPYGLKIPSPYFPFGSGTGLTQGHLQSTLDFQRSQLNDYNVRVQLGIRNYQHSLGLSPFHAYLTDPYAQAYFYKHDPRARFVQEEPKPSHSYIGLIGMAILNSKEKKLVLSDIYQWILDNYPYFRTRGPGWRNSIRHNLSLNDCFIKSGRSANGKGHYWAVHPANVDDFERGDFRRRRAQRKVRRHMGLSVPDDDDSPSPSPTQPWTHHDHLSSPESRDRVGALVDHPDDSKRPLDMVQGGLPKFGSIPQSHENPHGLLIPHLPHHLHHAHHHHHHPHTPTFGLATLGMRKPSRKRLFDMASLLAPDDEDEDLDKDKMSKTNDGNNIDNHSKTCDGVMDEENSHNREIHNDNIITSTGSEMGENRGSDNSIRFSQSPALGNQRRRRITSNNEDENEIDDCIDDNGDEEIHVTSDDENETSLQNYRSKCDNNMMECDHNPDNNGDNNIDDSDRLRGYDRKDRGNSSRMYEDSENTLEKHKVQKNNNNELDGNFGAENTIYTDSSKSPKLENRFGNRNNKDDEEDGHCSPDYNRLSTSRSSKEFDHNVGSPLSPNNSDNHKPQINNSYPSKHHQESRSCNTNPDLLSNTFLNNHRSDIYPLKHPLHPQHHLHINHHHIHQQQLQHLNQLNLTIPLSIAVNMPNFTSHNNNVMSHLHPLTHPHLTPRRPISITDTMANHSLASLRNSPYKATADGLKMTDGKFTHSDGQLDIANSPSSSSSTPSPRNHSPGQASDSTILKMPLSGDNSTLTTTINSNNSGNSSQSTSNPFNWQTLTKDALIRERYSAFNLLDTRNHNHQIHNNKSPVISGSSSSSSNTNNESVNSRSGLAGGAGIGVATGHFQPGVMRSVLLPSFTPQSILAHNSALSHQGTIASSSSSSSLSVSRDDQHPSSSSPLSDVDHSSRQQSQQQNND